MKVYQILFSIIVTLIAWFVGTLVGEALLATREVGFVLAICAMGSCVIAFCDTKQ
jgi:fucose permease